MPELPLAAVQAASLLERKGGKGDVPLVEVSLDHSPRESVKEADAAAPVSFFCLFR